MRPWILIAVLGLAAPAAGEDVAPLLARSVEAYGGEAALENVLFRQEGKVTSLMRGGRRGSITRIFDAPDRLRVEVGYPGEGSEVRVLDGAKGWRQGTEVSGAPFDAMVLQAARFSLPLNLLAHREEVVDKGTVRRGGKDVRVLELSLTPSMTLEAEIDTASGRILRSVGRGRGGPMGSIDFVTEYDDFRTVGGILFAFREVNYAMGTKTGETTLETVELLEASPESAFRPWP